MSAIPMVIPSQRGMKIFSFFPIDCQGRDSRSDRAVSCSFVACGLLHGSHHATTYTFHTYRAFDTAAYMTSLTTIVRITA